MKKELAVDQYYSAVFKYVLLASPFTHFLETLSSSPFHLSDC